MTTPARPAEHPAHQAASSPARRDQADRVHSGGTMWRLRSLVAMGHDATRIARALDISPSTARRLIRGHTATTTPELADLTRQLWDAWWDKRPQENTPAARHAAATARRTAQRNGWCQPAGLDEEHLDQPGYRPYAIWRPAAGTGTADGFPADTTAPAPGRQHRAASPPHDDVIPPDIRPGPARSWRPA
jgi:hypothetical protein